MFIDYEGNAWCCKYDSEEFTFDYSSENLICIGHNIKQICSDESNTILLLNDKGEVWGKGCNMYGNLGQGHQENVPDFILIMTNIKQISCDAHTMLLDNNGIVWASGCNSRGQLGLGHTGDIFIFTQIMSDAKKVICGPEHSIILKNDNTVLACGSNDYNQVSINDGNVLTFQEIKGDFGIVRDIKAGMDHTIILDENDVAWGIGANYNHELGDIPYSCVRNPIQIMTNVLSISCGFSHTMLLDNNGVVWVGGLNAAYELGFNHNEKVYGFCKLKEGIKKISCITYYNFLIDKNDVLWVSNTGLVICMDNINILADCEEECISYPKSARNVC
jgi:alpha-tubulin suppressor-like RCC1 family protein